MTDDPRNDRNMVSVPFIFVRHGDPLPVRWMAEHPDYLKVPAVMVPRGTRPSPTQGDAGAGAAAAALKPAPAAAARILGSFAPKPAREKRMRGGQPWPKDRNGGDWPADRWGRPTRPLWDYPPGVRAPGEGVAAGAPGGIDEAEAIGSARAALAALDPATLRAILASDRTGGGTGGTQTPPRGVASRYPGAYDVAQARSDQTGVWSDASPVAGAPAAARGTPAQTLRAAEEAAVAASPNDCGRAVQELLRRTGNPDEPYRTANDFMDMVVHGSGWRQVTQAEASRLANEGQVVIGGLAVLGGHGHILAVMPGPMRPAGGFMSNGTLIPPGDLAPPAMSGSMSNYVGAHSRGEKTTRDAWTPNDYKKVTFWTRQ